MSAIPGRHVVVVGTQWGDEGKGKLVDWLTETATGVVRFQGGHNAGHTVVVGAERYALQLVPSGVLYPHVTPVIGNGVVVDPAVLLHEIEGLEAQGIDTSKLVLSANAHIITPYHIMLDKVTERFLGKSKIGTTGRGIGPTYSDKVARVGIRVQDLFDEKILRAKVEGALINKNQTLVKVYNRRAVEADAIVDEGDRAGEQLGEALGDRAEGHRGLAGALGAAEVGGQDEAPALANQELEGGEGLLDPGVVIDDHAAVLLLHGDVVVDPQEDAFATDIKVTNGQLRHRNKGGEDSHGGG